MEFYHVSVYVGWMYVVETKEFRSEINRDIVCVFTFKHHAAVPCYMSNANYLQIIRFTLLQLFNWNGTSKTTTIVSTLQIFTDPRYQTSTNLSIFE